MRTIIALALLSLVAYSPTVSAADLNRGKQLFNERCTSCHGPSGAGDGPVAAALPPEMKPRDLTLGQFKVATDDAKMKHVIKTGGAANGLNALMPMQPDLNDADLDSVVAFVRSLKKK